MLDFGVSLSALENSSASLDRAAQRIAHIGTVGRGDSVELSAEAVDIIQARLSCQANIQVVRTGEALDQSLFDVFA